MLSTNTHYDHWVTKWQLADAMYSGENVESYLMKAAFEPKEAFQERRKLSSFSPYTRDIIQRLVGALFTREVQRTVNFPEEWLKASGPKGQSYDTQMVTLASHLLLYDEAWALVDGLTLHILPPLLVPRWTDAEVMVKGERVVPTSITEDEKEEDVFTVYSAGGYVILDEEGGAIQADDYGTGSFNGPPIVHLQMPWSAPLGIQLAKAHRAIYQAESDLDAMLRNASHALLQVGTNLVAEGEEGGMLDLVGSVLKQGGRAIPYNREFGEHSFINPSAENAREARERLQQKVEGFYRTAYETVNVSRVQQSATEAVLTEQTGTAAALSILAATMQSAENSILSIVDLAHDLTKKEGSADVEYPNQYASVEVDLRGTGA